MEGQGKAEKTGSNLDMKMCPKCGMSFERLLALSRTDNETMICDACGTREALESLPQGILSPQDRIRIEVMATRNRSEVKREG